MESEFEVYFPDQVGGVIEYYELLQKRTILLLQKMRGRDTKAEIAEVDDTIFEMCKPESFSGKESLEVKSIKRFEEKCIFLAQHVPIDPKRMTVLEFYQALETINKGVKKQKRLNGKSGKSIRSRTR